MDYRECFNDVNFFKTRKKRLFAKSADYKAFVNFFKIYSLGKQFIKFYKSYWYRWHYHNFKDLKGSMYYKNYMQRKSLNIIINI